MTSHRKIGFLSFGAWHPGGGLTRTGGDALLELEEEGNCPECFVAVEAVFQDRESVMCLQ